MRAKPTEHHRARMIQIAKQLRCNIVESGVIGQLGASVAVPIIYRKRELEVVSMSILYMAATVPVRVRNPGSVPAAGTHGVLGLCVI